MKIKGLFALVFCLLISLSEIINMPVSGQQIKINAGTFLNYSAAYIVVNGNIDNTGTIKNNGLLGLRATGDLQNRGIFVAGSSNHKIGGSLSNYGVFSSLGSTFTFNGSSIQTIEGANPADFNNLIIDNAYGVILTGIGSNTVKGDLIIHNGKKFEIAPGKLLIVSGTISNYAGTGGFVMHSDETGEAKLINNTPSVNGTVELYLTGGSGTFGPAYHYFVPPVMSMSINNADPVSTATSLSLTNFYGDLIAYNEPLATTSKDYGWVYFDGYTAAGAYPYAPFDNIASSRGYNIYLRSDDRPVFKGELNATDHTFNLSKSTPGFGWNLVGNPYPCNYDLQGVQELSTDQVDGIDNTVYFTHEGSYAYWNVFTNIGINWDSDVLPPMQGFFVHVTESSTLSLPASSKTSLTSSSRAKGDDPDEAGLIKKVRLILSNGQVSDAMVVCLIDKATTGFDRDFDAYKLFGTSTSIPFIYSELNVEKYAINSLKGPESEPVIVPVTVVIKNQGTYKIDIPEFDNLEDLIVVLRHGAIETVLAKDASYTFASMEGTYTDFQLIFGKSHTGLDYLNEEKIKIWYSNEYLYLHFPDGICANQGRLLIYGIHGKIVYNNNVFDITPGQTIQVPLILPPGIYVSMLLVNNHRYILKFVVI